MAYGVTLIPGDGIGPEVVDATKYVLESTGIKFDWDVQAAGRSAAEIRNAFARCAAEFDPNQWRGAERADNDRSGNWISQRKCGYPAGAGPLCQSTSHQNHDRRGEPLRQR